MYDAGSVKTWVYLPATHPNWQEATIKEPEWRVLLQLIKDSRNDMDRISL